MDGAIDSHQWASKMQTQCLLSGKPDLDIDPDALMACDELAVLVKSLLRCVTCPFKRPAPLPGDSRRRTTQQP